jgi:hypothetical protein
MLWRVICKYTIKSSLLLDVVALVRASRCVEPRASFGRYLGGEEDID